MRCFLACFGSSKSKRRPKSTPVSSSPAPPPKFRSPYKPLQQNLALKQAKLDESTIVVSKSLAKQEGKLKAGVPKQVSFVSNVRFHNPRSVSLEKAADISTGRTVYGAEKNVDSCDSIAEQNVLTPASENGGSTLSSLGSYPPNHRYHNCRESDNEDELDCEVQLDLDDYDEEDNLNASQEQALASISSVESRTRSPTSLLHTRNLDADGMLDDHDELKAIKSKTNSESVLNLDERQQAVDASLSSWIVSSQKTPSKKANPRMESIPSETTQTNPSSHGSNSVRNFSDRPILGALTIEDVRQISAFESPRKSSSHNIADRPIIGSVGSHWSEETSSVQPGSPSSFKGIPNITSKYREDKMVKWHTTPFETRLEQALKTGASEGAF